MKFLKKPKAPGQARGHTDHKLTIGLAHNIARHMFTPAMPYDQVWGCGTRWKCPFIGPKSVFDKPWCKGVGGVTWRHRGVFPIRLDRWKTQSVYFLNMHGRARPSHTGLERSDHYGSEVGPKNGKKKISKPGCQKYRGGNLAPPWSFFNPFGPLESLRFFVGGAGDQVIVHSFVDLI